MTAIFEGAIINIIQQYPAAQQGDLTLSKMNLLTFLVDWHLRINLKRGFDGVVWMNDAFGPNSKDVQNILERQRVFKKIERTSLSGRQVFYYGLAASTVVNEISEDVLLSIKHVLKLNAERRVEGAPDPGSEFKRLVLSTYGIMNTKRNNVIDIAGMAQIYRREVLKK